MVTQQQWREYKAHPDAARREQLIAAYASFARYLVGRVAIRTSTLSEEDLLGQALIGLLEAIDRYDPEQGVKFETFAYYRIRGAVLDMVRRMDLLPQSARESGGKLSAVYEQLLSKLRRQPTDEEVAGALGISVEQLDGVLQDSHAQAVLSLDLPISDEEGTANTLLDSLPGRADSLEDTVIRGEDQRRVASAIDQLPEAERQVISLYYHEGLTMKEIGLVLSVTESRVCQIHAKAIARLKATLRAEEQLPCP